MSNIVQLVSHLKDCETERGSASSTNLEWILSEIQFKNDSYGNNNLPQKNQNLFTLFRLTISSWVAGVKI